MVQRPELIAFLLVARQLVRLERLFTANASYRCLFLASRTKSSAPTEEFGLVLVGWTLGLGHGTLLKIIITVYWLTKDFRHTDTVNTHIKVRQR